MKKLSLFLIALAMVLTSCKPEIEKPTVVTKSVGEVAATTAKVVGQVTEDGGAEVSEKGICWNTSGNPEIIDFRTKEGPDLGSFTSTLVDLTPLTTYYVRAYAINEAGISYGAEKTFITNKKIELAEVTTAIVEDITETTAVSGGEVISDGGAEVTARGICWNISQNPTIKDYKTIDGKGIGKYISDITHLKSNTTYYVRSYATNEAGTSYGEEVSFTTLEVTPEDPETPGGEDPENPGGEDPETPGGEDPENPGGEDPENPGGEDPEPPGGEDPENPGGEDPENPGGEDPENPGGEDPEPPGGEDPENPGGEDPENPGGEDPENPIEPEQPVGPVVTTASVTEITISSAVCGGNVISGGNAVVTARGVCWSTSHNPTISDSYTVDGNGLGSFTSTLTNLAPQTTYYIRSYATNSQGVTSYGEEVSFTTLSKRLPTVTTSAVSGITLNSSICGGDVTSDGDAVVTARGVCWSTSHNPTISDSYTVDGSGIGSFTSNLINLSSNTTYYVRAYAANEVGTAYGEEVTFTTLEKLLPTVTTTSEVTDITVNSAKCGGEVTFDGNVAVTARGICWSTSQNPTIEDSKTTNGSGLGSYTSKMTGLEHGTTYYVRAYATNEVGTAYGEEVSFTTIEKLLPTVTTATKVTDITVSSAVCGGEVTFDGNVSVIARGICWSTSQNPTIEDSKTTNGEGIGFYTSNMINLEHNTTYYVRAYATNEVGTAYGEEVSFTTLLDPVNGREYVDLGLSVKWATCNVGANAPEEYGDYFAWGETSPKEEYTEENSLTYGKQMSDISGNAQYDAATANWGGSWRMPTKAEQQELLNNCTWTWTTQNGVNGYNVEGPNGNSIFLPAAGYRYGSSLNYAGSRGYYWSSTPYGFVGGYDSAYGLAFDSSNLSMNGYYRYAGRSVRPILE